jgi:hypothetical protein
MRTVNLVGQQVGRWTIVERDRTLGLKGKRYWCQCSCGTPRKSVSSTALSTLRSKSCGCLRRELGAVLGASSVKHGACLNGKLSPEYQAWSQMKNRCTNPNSPGWAYYGGRGITICARWEGSYGLFLADMGPRPQSTTPGSRSGAYSLDRIDNSLGYSPENCRWATSVEQNNNLRKAKIRPGARSRTVTIRGDVYLLAEALETFGCNVNTFFGRKRAGMSDEEAITTPAPTRRRLKKV